MRLTQHFEWFLCCQLVKPLLMPHSRRCPHVLFGLFISIPLGLFSQVEDDFEVRFQTQEKGGIVLLANVSLSCGSSNNCSNTQSAMPVTGNSGGDNNDFNMEFEDWDTDPDTWMSTSDSLDLGPCAEVLWAGLYWASRVTGNTPNYGLRNQLKFKATGDPYLDLTADELYDFDAGYFDAYFCFKDVTDLVQANPVNSRYTIANMVSREDDSTWGGWTLVVVYADALESMRNLTVFDGFAYINSNNNQVDLPIEGFVTPLNGPVSFELGVIAYDGDRNSSGDQMAFNGAGAFMDVQDALHEVNNLFNSTHARGGAIAPHRIPAFNNTLGHDANVFIPDNSSFDFLSNNSSSGTIRISTGGESIMVQTVTSVIDVFEPDLKATVYIEDLNGGIVSPGDVLEYTVVGKNVGSDLSVNTFMADSLDLRVDFVPGSIVMLNGPNAGPKTDGPGDDQAEYDPLTNSVTMRVGAGANALNGGAVINNPTGADSTVFKFQGTLTDDCLILQCNGTLEGVAYIFGDGDISGNSNTNNGQSSLLDDNGCPIGSVTELVVETGTCPPVEVSLSGTSCLGDDVEFFVPNFQNNPLAESLANYVWSGPGGYASTNSVAEIADVAMADAGVYLVEMTFDGLECILNTADYQLEVFDPAPLFEVPASQCLEGNSFDFVAQGATSATAAFEWNFPGSAMPVVVGPAIDGIQFMAPGWYAVVLTLQENGCGNQFLDSVYVEAAPVVPALDISFDPASGCPPIIVHFHNTSANQPLDYLWSFGDGSLSDESDPVHAYMELGTFDVSVTASSATNCVTTVEANLPQAVYTYNGPESGFSVSPQVVDILDGEVFITSFADSDLQCYYSMTDGGSLVGHDGQYTFVDAGVFQIVQTVVDADGCSSTALGEVSVSGTVFYAPTAFTPDNDGLNDVWRPEVLGVTEYDLTIFNRWGEVVWQTMDPEAYWLGQVNSGSHYAPNGIYHWTVRLEDQLLFPRAFSGTVELIR